VPVRSNAPFSRRSDVWLRSSIAALIAAVLLGVPGVLMGWVRSPLHTRVGEAIDQPVEFDHRHHVRDDAIDCKFCHYDVTRAPTAGVPETALCMGCHAQIWSDSPLLEPVRESYFSGRPIEWRRVHDLPDFVFFNHSIHVKKGVGCESCHGRVDQMSRVHAVASLHMGWCLDCHRNPEPHLRPPELVTAVDYRPAEPQPALGARLRRQLDVNPPTNCSACHR
jgi:hypothetical protein